MGERHWLRDMEQERWDGADPSPEKRTPKRGRENKKYSQAEKSKGGEVRDRGRRRRERPAGRAPDRGAEDGRSVSCAGASGGKPSPPGSLRSSWENTPGALLPPAGCGPSHSGASRAPSPGPCDPAHKQSTRQGSPDRSSFPHGSDRQHLPVPGREPNPAPCAGIHTVKGISEGRPAGGAQGFWRERSPRKGKGKALRTPLQDAPSPPPGGDTGLCVSRQMTKGSRQTQGEGRPRSAWGAEREWGSFTAAAPWKPWGIPRPRTQCPGGPAVAHARARALWAPPSASSAAAISEGVSRSLDSGKGRQDPQELSAHDKGA
ncbi:LOW QUALITY PROTEIN: hypothetical protein MC885_016644 [Smutsia gigantea]|nr:LOW QUALITY PROTEIN: hypothetical protein MC885_016644 [Smutsia gigantea]